MKKLNVFLMLFVLACFFASAVNAQAIVEKDNLWYLNTGYDVYESYDHQQVITPDGSVNFRASFKASLEDPMIMDAMMYGKYTIEVVIWLEGGDVWYEVPVAITVYPNGNVKVRGHLEGEEY